MPATFSNDSKFSLKYSAINGSNQDDTARTISGLNIVTSQVEGSGPTRTNGVTALFTELQKYTTASFDNIRWIQEMEVTL